jgi:hypothetical protein
MLKAYAYLFAFLAALGALWGVYHMGGASCRESAANAARASLEAQNVLLAELEANKPKREVIYREKVRIVEASTDSCMDARLPDDARMQLNGGATPKPTPNP